MPLKRPNKMPNRITKAELALSRGLPPIHTPGKTDQERDALSVRMRVMLYFRDNPEDRLLIWFKLWKCVNPAQGDNTIRWFRQSYFKDMTYVMRRDGCYIWFSKRPGDSEEWTDEQRELWAEYNRQRGTPDELSLRRRARMGSPSPMAQRLSALREREALHGAGEEGPGPEGDDERDEPSGEASSPAGG